MVHTVPILDHSQGSSVKQLRKFSPKWIKTIFFRVHLRKIIWLKTIWNVADTAKDGPSIESQAGYVHLSTFSCSVLGIFKRMQHNCLRVLLQHSSFDKIVLLDRPTDQSGIWNARMGQTGGPVHLGCWQPGLSTVLVTKYFKNTRASPRVKS